MPQADPNQQRLIDSDQMVTAERSMFGTRLPRPTGVGRHLLIVIIVCAIALGIAIAFANRSTDEAPPSAAASTPTAK